MQEIPQDSMEVIYVDSEETTGEDGKAVNVLDGDPSTIWHTEWYNSSPDYPHEIVLGLNKKYDIENFSYLPRQNSSNGRIKEFEIYVTSDTSNWGSPVASGTWENQIPKKIVEFAEDVNGQYVKLKALSEVNGNEWATAAELNLNDSIDIDPNTDLDGWASSLHLGFQDPSSEDAELLMVDIKVDSSSPNTYYAPINFIGGYCGIQDIGDRRTLHFSLWDYVDGDQRAVPEEAAARILWRGYNVEGSDFGGEGTGIKTWKEYDWKNNQPYRLAVKMRPETVDTFPGSTRDYWVLDFATGEWMHIATLWRAANPESGELETDLGEVFAFIEDWAATAEWHRSCYVYNARKQYRSGGWHAYDQAYYNVNDNENNPFTVDGHDPNTQAEIREENKIWLATGGDFIPDDRTPSGTIFNFTPNTSFDPESPELTDIDYNIVNDSTINISWSYAKAEWAAQEYFDVRIYADENMDSLLYKTGPVFPHDYESQQTNKNSDRHYQLTNSKLKFKQNDYYLRLVTRTIFGINSWNDNAVKLTTNTDIDRRNSTLPEKIELLENYPNPFNPETRISYRLPESMAVSLEIYNLQGKLIRTLVNCHKQRGLHTNIWNGHNDQGRRVNSGIYFYRLKANGQVNNRKMVLIK
jgi:hypothetical protein